MSYRRAPMFALSSKMELFVILRTSMDKIASPGEDTRYVLLRGACMFISETVGNLLIDILYSL